jgi:alanyl-tRNA synthetase
MRTDEIRHRFHDFFVDRGHLLIPSGSLVPAAHDPSVLLTVAGMQPLKPYFLGQEQPPRRRLTSVQKCFRTVDIDVVGTTARHLTFFEMLGNFSVGDYFKQGAVEFAWELSTQGFGLDPDQIWITVFEGDEALGIPADDEAIEAWTAVGVPRERIVACPRSENFWQAGPTGPCGPCSELYLDRGVEFGRPDDLPGGENERFLEYWNLVFMQYDQNPPDTLTPLPAQNIDTGMGLERMAAIMQDVPSVFDTDTLRPLIDLGESLSGRRSGTDPATDRALRILADHTRGMNFLIADGVVPSNEERGYVLRRIMRRAIQQGRTLGLEPGFLGAYSKLVRELMGDAYPELIEQRPAIDKWLSSEEESFGRTLEQGMRTLRELIDRGRESGAVAAADAFRLHDTYGFPFELTKALVAEEGLTVDEDHFDQLMARQRSRSRSDGGRGSGTDSRAAARAFAAQTGFTTNFVGYQTLDQATTVGAVDHPAAANGGTPVLVKLADSPFYPAGGGQVSDAGVIEGLDGEARARVAEVVRLGDDQAVLAVVESGELREGERVVARVDRAARHATECNHTATHLLQAALRRRLGDHVRQAGSYVGPDKLRFDFSHSQGLTTEELRDVEDQVNAWIAENHPVRPIITTLAEARGLGAMALFGEKYGDIVRMVEVGDGGFSRELCGGTHVRSTGEIGVMRIVGETSSAANVRRIEALTGPAGVALLREHDRLLGAIARTLRTRPEDALAAVEAREEERRTSAYPEKGHTRRARSGAAAAEASPDLDELIGRAVDVDGARVLTAEVPAADEKALLGLLDRLKPKLGDAAIVLGAASGGRALFVASVAPSVVARGVRAGAVVRAAAEVAGGGGGGRDTMARAGGRDGAKVGAAIAAARDAIAGALRDG